MRTTHETRFNLTAKDKTKAVIKGAEKNLKRLDGVVGKLGVGFVGLAGIGGIALFVSAQVKAAKQALSYADALNVSVESLTAWQFAGESVGLAADKIADIMKDSAEKIGDAFRNNAGEAKEALESLNLSIEDMNKLSPDKQLLEIAKALDEVGTQGEKIQILESLGNDASLLLPLLKDNAAELKKLMKVADDTGKTLTRIEADKLAEVDKKTRELSASFDGLAQSITVTFVPVLTETIGFLNTIITRAGQAGDALVDNILDFVDPSEVTKGLEALDILRDKLVISSGRFDYFTLIGDTKRAADEFIILEDLIKKVSHLELLRGNLGRSFTESDPIIVEGGVGTDIDEKLLASFTKLDESLKSEEQRIAESHLVRQQILIDAEAAGIESIVPFDDLKIMLAQQHEDKLTAVVLKGLSDREKFQIKSAKAQTKSVIGEMVGLTQGVAQHSKTMFNINKTAGIANALIGTYESFTRTMGAYPYPINIGLAALSLAAGLAQVQAIRSTSFSGGGGGTTPSAAGGVPTINDTPVPTLPNIDTTPQSFTEVNLTITGGVHDSEAVRELIEAINDEIGDGVQLNATVT